MTAAKLDQIGYWSEVKLDIIKEYAQTYSKILSAQSSPPFHHVYVDAFAGAGVHISKQTGEFVLGSPLNALQVVPPFKEYHLIDLDGDKVESLRKLTSDHANTRIHPGDCNQILREQVFPLIDWNAYKRGLCVLDPYGLHLHWDVVQMAGQMRSIELFLNFPVMDMNMNVLWSNRDDVDPAQADRMTAFWGDDSWREAAYKQQKGLFGPIEEKTGNQAVAEAYRKRLRTIAGFKHVPAPMPMRNTKGAIIYYLFFASPKPVAADIVTWLFEKYRKKGTA